MLQFEINNLFPNRHSNLNTDVEPDELLNQCLEYAIDYEFIMAILWDRIYTEPFVMKFISLRNSNHIKYESFGEETDSEIKFTYYNRGPEVLAPVFPLF